MMAGGWLEFLIMYTGVLLGFLYVWYVSVSKLKVASRKSTNLKFASTAILTEFFENQNQLFSGFVCASYRPSQDR